MQAEQGAAYLPVPITPDLSPTASKTWTWEKAIVRPFSKSIKNGSPKRQPFMDFGTLLPTSSAHPKGSPVAASLIGVTLGGTPFPVATLTAPGHYLVTQADPSTSCRCQQELHPGPPLLPDMLDTAQPISQCPIILPKTSKCIFM